MQRVNYSLALQAPEYRLQTPRANHQPGNHPNFTPNSSLTSEKRITDNQKLMRMNKVPILCQGNSANLLGQLSMCVQVCGCTSDTWKTELLLRMKEKETPDHDVWASKCRLWICTEAKICSRRHFHPNRPYCVCVHPEKHTQTQTILKVIYSNMCVSALYNCSQMAGECVCLYLYCRWDMGD